MSGITRSLLLLLATLWAVAASASPLRVAVLKFGTVNWELDVIRHHGLAEAEGVTLEVTALGSRNAVNVALQGKAADLVVGDWIWVSRQRAEGRDYTCVPYSRTVGSLVAAADSGLDSLEDLGGRRLGIAGGPVDKSWLLLRAYARRHLDMDLATGVEPVFAAPPLLNQLLLRGELEAVLNYWHYAARLQARGNPVLLSVAELLPELGIDQAPPLLCWIFRESWADENRAALSGFLRASYRAKALLATSDAEWQRIAALTRAENETVLAALMSHYRAGIPEAMNPARVAAAAEVFRLLAEEGGRELVGASARLQPGTFWEGFGGP